MLYQISKRSIFRAIGQFYIQISRLRDFTRFYNKTSYRILKRSPDNESCWAETAWMNRSNVNRVDEPLRWRHNGRDVVPNHQPHGCLLNRSFRRRSKKTSKLRVTGLCVGNSPGPVNSPHKRPVTRKMFPFDDVIMISLIKSEYRKLSRRRNMLI